MRQGALLLHPRALRRGSLRVASSFTPGRSRRARTAFPPWLPWDPPRHSSPMTRGGRGCACAQGPRGGQAVACL